MIQKRPTNRQVVGIGMITGILIVYLGYSALKVFSGDFSWWDIFLDFFVATILGLVFASPYSITGALIGRNWKTTIRATWIGAIAGTIIGLGILFLAISFAHLSRSRADFITPDYILYLLPGLPFGINGAMIGNDWKQSNPATWIGGILGAIIGIILFGWLYWWASFGFASG